MNEPNYSIPPAVAFTVFGIEIRYYAIMIILGVILAIVVVSFLFKRRNIPVSWVLDLLLCVLPLGIIGARTFSVVTDPGSSIAEWFTGFRDGGLSITGGIIGGALGVVLFCLIHKINFLRVADCLLPGVILAQAMGRWGNFFNQEVYGGLVTDPSMQWFPFAVYIEREGAWHYAFFFYEMLANLVIFALLFTLMWKFKKRPHGLSMCGYFFGYGLVRSIMEPLRDPQFQLGHNVMISEVFAIIMCVGGFLLAVILIGWNKYKHGSFFGSKDGEPLAILPVYHTKEELKKQEEQQKLTEARIRQAGGDIPAEAPAEAAVPAAPKEKKPLSARWKEWWAAFPDRAREFFRPYSAEQGGTDGAEDPAAGESKSDPAADGNAPADGKAAADGKAPADGETPADAPAEEGASAGNGAEGNGAERSGKDGGEV